MNSVERVKSICKERNIPISRLEKDLGYANGYIGQLRKGVLPDDRLSAIAKYLSVPTNYLITGEKEEKPATQGDGLSERADKFSKIFDQISTEGQDLLEKMAESLPRK